MPQLTFEFLAFVSGFVALYWLLPARAQGLLLAAGSTLFLAYLDPVSLGLLATLTVCVYLAIARQAERGSRWWIVSALLVALFFGAKLLAALDDEWGLPRLVIPLGFGFYVLKLIHYAVESRRGTFAPHGLLTFYNYMLLFPTVLVGPIHRFEDYLRSERRKRWDPSAFAGGLSRILYGYGKVVVLANWLAAVALPSGLAAVVADGSPLSVFGECLTYGFYLYFAFAGYSDVAIGICLLLGYRVGENFHYPFLQRNLRDFWRCWHMSLSDWCRRYIYTPVAARWRRPTIAVVAAMLGIGLWHELTPRYVLWGLYHGLGLAAWRAFAGRVAPRLPAPKSSAVRGLIHVVAVALTFVFVMISFAITKNSTLSGMAGDFDTLLLGWAHDRN